MKEKIFEQLDSLPNFFQAIVNDNIDYVHTLTCWSKNLILQTYKNLTALHFAVIFDRKEIVNILLKCNAKIDAKDNKGLTPLDHANINGFTEIAEIIVKHKNHQDSLARHLNNDSSYDSIQEAEHNDTPPIGEMSKPDYLDSN